ncbi:type II secretion system F family protein [Kiloniella majae]|uniref:type II secretion system F family protein n=1 Tax=Kiloniella majae TaxID=1938558 RepID=UPI000A276E91|nr:type II secretion system F family protein [Kiloniella majae]
MISFFEKILNGQATDLQLSTAILVALFILLIVLFFALKPNNKKVKKRINRIVNTTHNTNIADKSLISIRRQTESSGSLKLDKIIQKLTPQPELLRDKMQKAGLQPNLGRFLFIIIAITILSFGILQLVTDYPIMISILFALIIGLIIPHLGLYFLKIRRHKKFLALFPDAIDLMVRALKSGLPITEAIKNSGEEIANPVGIELTTVTDGVKIGGKLPDELIKAQSRIGLQEFNFFTVALSIQTETGGNLAETLANLSDILRKRKQMQLKVKAMSSEAKASAYIIGSLPFIMFILIYFLNRPYAVELLTDPRGQFAIGVGLFMIVLGCGIMYKMVKFEI